MLGFGFSIGAQVLMARRNGEKDYRGIGPVFTQGMAFLLLLAALLFTASRLWGPGCCGCSSNRTKSAPPPSAI